VTWVPPPLGIRPLTPADCEGAHRVQTWPDPDGVARAAAYRTAAGYLIEWDGVARFALAPAGAAVCAEPCVGVPHVAVHDTYERSVAPFVWQAFHGEALHASAVVVGGRVVICCAASGTGKTTLAWALAERGHALVADDAVLLREAETGLCAFALPHRVRLRRGSAVFFGLGDPGPSGRVERLTGAESARPIHTVFVLERQPGRASPEAQQLGGAAALGAVLAHAHCLDPTDDDVRRRALALYLACVSSAPVWRLSLPSNLERLPQAVTLIEHLLEGGAP
jgi:hypothetical protein